MKQTKKELPTDSIGYYKVMYENGVIQHKLLIQGYVFDRYILYLKMLDESFTGKEREEQVAQTKTSFKKKYGEHIFTTHSPLAAAIRTGVLVTPFVEMNVKFEKL